MPSILQPSSSHPSRSGWAMLFAFVLLDSRLDPGLDPGPWALDSRLDPGPWTLDPRPWTLDPGLPVGPWTLDPGPWTLDPGPWTLELNQGWYIKWPAPPRRRPPHMLHPRPCPTLPFSGSEEKQRTVNPQVNPNPPNPRTLKDREP